jgi:hypothetical protein
MKLLQLPEQAPPATLDAIVAADEQRSDHQYAAADDNSPR